MTSDSDEMTRVLVTGGTGFIGRHAASALLDHGCEVTVVSRLKRPESLDDRAEYLRADLIDPKSSFAPLFLHRPDILMHLAWETRHGHFWQAPENLLWAGASLRLLHAFAAQGGKRVVCAGSCVEYNPPEQGPCVPGETAVAPQHLYAVAKDAFHRVLACYAREAGLSFVWGRVFNALGPHEAAARVVPSVVQGLLRGETVRCSSGRQVRDFMDVRDYGSAFATLALSKFEGPINVCSGDPITLAEVITTLGRIIGRTELIAFGALPDRKDEAQNLWGDATALKASGFKPSYPLDKALVDAVEWWRRRTNRVTANKEARP
jgi:nucleoside-diphosphate-sugar epimerase